MRSVPLLLLAMLTLAAPASAGDATDAPRADEPLAEPDSSPPDDGELRLRPAAVDLAVRGTGIARPWHNGFAARQKDLHRGSPAWHAADRDVAIGLLYKAVHHGKVNPGSLADALAKHPKEVFQQRNR